MAMRVRKVEQVPIFLTLADLPVAPTVPFLDKLDEILVKSGFDEFVARLCQPFYATVLGRPSLPPGVYFRLLLPGYLIGISVHNHRNRQTRPASRQP